MSASGRNDPCPCGSGKKYKQCCHLRPPAPTKNNSAAAIQNALEHHRAGRLAQAEEIYKQILETDPSHSDALHYLGVIASSQGKYEEAAGCIKRAIQSKPSRSMYYNLGNALCELKKLDEAAESYRHAIALKPDYAEAYFNLGNVFNEQGKRDKAVENYRLALALKPDYAEMLRNILRQSPAQGKHALALDCYRLALTPNLNHDAKKVFIIANRLEDLGDLDAATACYRRVLALKPGYAEAYYNLSNMLYIQGKIGEAEENCRKVLAIKPGHVEAHFVLGSVLKDLCQLASSVECYRKVLSLKPNHIKAYSNLLYLHAFTRNISPEQEYDLASKFECLALSENERTIAHQRFTGKPDRPPRTGRKLKLGIVSAELGQHAVAEFLEPFLEQLNRSRFHLTLYPTIARMESRAARFRELANEYIPLITIPDKEAADLIRSDKIDILIDTTGHMRGCRLGIFAHRAAPVQCHYIGYHGTTGLTEMDWYIADGVLLPPAYDTHFRERIWRLPRLRMAYKGNTSLPCSNWKPNPNGAILLGSFNNLTKVREEALDLWARIMNAIPQSKLLLKDLKATDPLTRQRITAELSRHGIGEERIELIAAVPDWDAHMALYGSLDIALDTIPLNSETTAFDALWMGVPLVALEGNWVGGRQASTILHALGKSEWVAHDEDEYVKIVVQLARDVEKRKQLRVSQRSLMAASPLCDAKGLARTLEATFEEMFDRWWNSASVSITDP